MAATPGTPGALSDPPRRPLCLRGGTLITCDAERRILRADLLVKGGRIARLGQIPRSPEYDDVDVRGRLIIPGLIMTHVHLCQTLMRGLASDRPLLDWLKQRIWPMEAAHTPRSLRISAELGLAELLLGGTTSILDLGTVHHYDEVFDACQRFGVRVWGGKALMDCGQGVPRGLRESTREALRDAERLEQTWSGRENGRLNFAWIPRFILSCSEKLIRGAVERAATGGGLLHTHAAEHAGEAQAVREQFGRSDVLMLRSWGFRGERASIAHGVQLRPSEQKTLARDGTRVVHCPSANLKLGSGLAPIAELREAGIVVGLGADGAPCNDNLDPWTELRHAALISSVRASPGALPAQEVLQMATLEGARLLGMDQEIGSIEVGKCADLVVVRQDGIHQAPALDPVASLVYATGARDVEAVFINGLQRVRSGDLIGIDLPHLVVEAKAQARALCRRAQI